MLTPVMEKIIFSSAISYFNSETGKLKTMRRPKGRLNNDLPICGRNMANNLITPGKDMVTFLLKISFKMNLLPALRVSLTVLGSVFSL